jgi:hypothetical protein
VSIDRPVVGTVPVTGESVEPVERTCPKRHVIDDDRAPPPVSGLLMTSCVSLPSNIWK